MRAGVEGRGEEGTGEEVKNALPVTQTQIRRWTLADRSTHGKHYGSRYTLVIMALY